MALDALMKELNLDRYDRNARLRPALFTVLPILVLVAIWYPKIWSFYGALASLLVTCGVTFLMAQFARQRGRQLESSWPTIGRIHSARLLSHSDATISAATKVRYHIYFSRHGIVLPTVQQERRNLTSANDQYTSAINWLLEHTRHNANNSLLLDENIAYGFRRNLRGLKPFALTILVFTLCVDILLIWRAGWTSPMLDSGVVLGLGLVAVALIWIFYITKSFVEDASLAYAQRLLAQCELTGSTANSSQPKITQI